MKKFLTSLNNKGFSLVELMVVVAIIGILASIALPKYKMFSAKAKTTEAKGTLTAIYSLEESYKAEKDTYQSTLSNLGWTVTNGARYNNVSLSNIAQGTFRATATAPANSLGVGCTLDTWTINESRTLNNSSPFTC